MIHPENDVFIGQSLAAYGEWCPAEIRLLSQVLGPGDVVVDGGANLGAHALPFARAVGPAGRVYAVEPQPGLLAMLSANALMNGYGNIVPVAAALGKGDEGMLDIPPIRYDATANFGGFGAADFAAAAAGRGTVRVPVRAVDDLFALDALRLLKLDVQGMELAALEGARATIALFAPVLYVECDAPDTVAPLLDFLAGRGYRAYWHAAPLFEPGNWRGNPVNLFGTRACVNILAVPEHQPVEGLRPVTGPEEHPFAVPVGMEL